MAVFLDLSKAFDTVSIPILLRKLEAVGVRGAVLEMFRSYLTERSQCVRVGNLISSEEFLTYGVPQGSVLGPTLFLVYINDLCQLTIENCKIVTYADDTALIVHAKDWQLAFDKTERALSAVVSWLNDNLLTLNTVKTKFITFSSSSAAQPPDSLQIRAHTCRRSIHDCDCLPLLRTSNIRYLGVQIDSRLSWENHISNIVSRTRKLIYVFKKLRNSADLDTLKLVYFSLAQSILMYCIPAWGGAFPTSMMRVERAQRAVLKVLLKKPIRYPTVTLYQQCSVLTVRQLFVLQTIIRKHASIPYKPDNRRRRDMVCDIQSHRTALASRSFYIIGSRLYNRINKITYIHNLTKNKCKNEITNLIKKLSYQETEDLLKPIS